MASTRGKRPKWVWAISIFYFVSSLYTCLSYYLIFSHSIPLGPSTTAYFNKMSLADWTTALIGAALSLYAAVTLFMLRKHCFYIFSASLVLGIGSTMRGSTRAWVSLNPVAGVGMLIGWGILLAVCLYTWKLTKAGILH